MRYRLRRDGRTRAGLRGINEGPGTPEMELRCIVCVYERRYRRLYEPEKWYFLLSDQMSCHPLSPLEVVTQRHFLLKFPTIDTQG